MKPVFYSILSAALLFAPACKSTKQPENTVQNEKADNATTRYAESLRGDVGTSREKVDKANEQIHSMEASKNEILGDQ